LTSPDRRPPPRNLRRATLVWPGCQGALHRTLGDLDPLMAAGTVTSFEEMLAKTTLIAKSVAALFGACFAFALLWR
jgi:hypothetical protein